jgi:hypothetical protein
MTCVYVPTLELSGIQMLCFACLYMFGLLQRAAKTYTTGLRPLAEPELGLGSVTDAATDQVRGVLGVRVFLVVDVCQ